MMRGDPRVSHELALRLSIAFVWLATALLVVHPHYREIGAGYLARLGLPAWCMYVACTVELALGARVAFGPSARWLTLVQLGGIAIFTATLACVDAMLLVHPFGMLSKNVPLACAILAHARISMVGWDARTHWTLRVGLAAIWITEGVFPKILFQQPMELAVVETSGLVPMDAADFLLGLGALQAASGIAVIILRGTPLRLLLAAQAVALVVLPLLVSWNDPLLWVHPFGPLTKNVPILVGTIVLAQRVSARAERAGALDS